VVGMGFTTELIPHPPYIYIFICEERQDKEGFPKKVTFKLTPEE
jgi:hypothetical protein